MAYCKKCGAENPEGYSFCTNCGSPLEKAEPAQTVQSSQSATPPVTPQHNTYYQQPRQAQPAPSYNTYNYNIAQETEPQGKYKPMGAWAYFGWSILFSFPIAGFVLLIVMSFNDNNINRRNFARSHWCSLLIFGIIALIVIVLIFAFGGASEISRFFRRIIQPI